MSNARFGQWLQGSATVKFIVIGILALVLMIPTSMVQSLVYEREQRQTDVQNEVGQLWGQEQIVEGPVISLAYTYPSRPDKDGSTRMEKGMLHWLPSNLKISGEVTPIERHRGLYKAIVYSAALKLQGQFNLSTAQTNLPEGSEIHWEKAEISLSLTDSRGIQQPIAWKINGKNIATEPGLKSFPSNWGGVHSTIDLGQTQTFSFETELALNGSHSLQFVPVGKVTECEILTPWNRPKFIGAFLPDSHDLAADPVSAHWKVLDFNRSYPQLWKDKRYDTYDSTVGLELLAAVGHYDKTRRSLEYALLIIALSFAAFFLYEVLQRQRLHPIQYSLVGFALVIFYLLLISFTEYLAFHWAYLLASATVAGLASSYFGSITKSWKSALGMGALMSLLYGFLYVVLSSEDYALLIGSIGLVIALAAIMYATRKVDWYHIQPKESAE